MDDPITTPSRRKNMQAVKCKDSEIELLLRRELWRLGVRYRKHVRSVIGNPDICIKKYRLAIFIDSEFWHGKDWDQRKSDFKSNRTFWIQKIERNIQRDEQVNNSLLKTGWMVFRFWGRDIKKNPHSLAIEVVNYIESFKQ